MGDNYKGKGNQDNRTTKKRGLQRRVKNSKQRSSMFPWHRIESVLKGYGLLSEKIASRSRYLSLTWEAGPVDITLARLAALVHVCSKQLCA